MLLVRIAKLRKVKRMKSEGNRNSLKVPLGIVENITYMSCNGRRIRTKNHTNAKIYMIHPKSDYV